MEISTDSVGKTIASAFIIKKGNDLALAYRKADLFKGLGRPEALGDIPQGEPAGLAGRSRAQLRGHACVSVSPQTTCCTVAALGLTSAGLGR